MAKLVGAILHESGNGSDRIADAHVVAACASAESAIILTSDPDDLTGLAAVIPGTRILVRDRATLTGN